ncbi:TonB-dependent receptor [Spirosoma utsteinense]|uniref:Iron complex outermembrane receptor protein n=1 Tax=Spirosoma utsteinense TaxID=2585773 RepID=A0ABR6W3B5_9BACT|nr:TonB-dependent receptor [Spirosoma utsteinense]MBC3786662.1 iron complex outermembrane receptor protein [Spirosoma utsteinense]MBC3791025.1 iron complex outermembrane receptor protein [Spirosoma utsteinense]
MKSISVRFIRLLLFFAFLSSSLYAQVAVTGRIVDPTNSQPIVGATVLVSGTSRGTTANDKGQFDLSVSEGDKLQISAIGYQTQTVPIKASTRTLTVELEPSNTDLNEVIVAGYASPQTIQRTAGAVGLVTSRDIQRTSGIHLQSFVNLIPGVKVEMRTVAAGNRIVIRGYGNQTNFNGVGYKAYLNDIPLTDGDGTTFLDDVDFTTLSRVEVLKGPGSSAYGNALGGVVNFYTERAPIGKTSISQQVLAGSYGLFRTNTSIKTGTDNTSLNINYGHQKYEGFRLHGSSKKDFLSITSDTYLSQTRSMSVFVGYTNSYDLLSGQVDSLNLIVHPDTAEVAYLRNNANIKTESARVGVSHSYQFTDHFSNKTTLFVGGQIIDQPFAAGVNKTNKFKFGGRTVFTYANDASALRPALSVGAEFLKNFNYAKGYGLTNGILGALRSDLEIQAMQYNIFAQAALQLAPRLTLSAGAGINYVEYGITDMRASTTTPVYVNASGYERFKPIVTPRGALSYQVADNVSLYASVSEGYSAPATNQVVIAQTGVVNYNLRPELGTSYEIGSKGSLLTKALTYEIAYFTMAVTNKLIPQNFPATATQPAYTLTANAGKVQHNGLELAVQYAYRPVAGAISLIRPFVSYTYSDFYYKDYRSDNNSDAKTITYTGKKESGIAPNLLNAGLDVEVRPGFYLNATMMYVDKMPITLANDHYAKAYTLVNSKLGYRSALGSHFNLDVYVGSDNMLSSTYSSLVFLNLPNPANNRPLFFNPAPKITFYSGAMLKYTF